MPEERALLRRRLIDQLAYLADEVDALGAVIGQVPPPLLTARLHEGTLSVVEVYGLLATTDEEVYTPWVAQWGTHPAPVLHRVPEEELLADTSWNEQPIGAVLARLRAARQALVRRLEALAPGAWEAEGLLEGRPLTLYDLAHHIALHDAHWMRHLAHRFHESHLTRRPQDLPK